MKCPYCGSGDTFPYHDVILPNIIAACPEPMIQRVKMFPFRAEICRSCYLGFNATVLPSEELRAIYDNYLYISPSQNIGSTKFSPVIDLIRSYCSKPELIVEIGCSEGFLLKALRENGYTRLIGIEPGPQAAKAESEGITVIREYFTENTLKQEKIDTFVLIHVFEHLTDPFGLLKIMRDRLTPGGKIILEVPDFTEGNFSNYNHQHLFYYNLPFFSRMCEDLGLKIIAAESDTEMSALRVVVVSGRNPKYPAITMIPDGQNILEMAKRFGHNFRKKIRKLEDLFKENASGTLFWWGAGSVSVIYLNQVKPGSLSETNLVIIDGDPNKWNCVIPGVNRTVRSFHEYAGSAMPFLIIASSFFREIRQTLASHNIRAERIMVIE